MENDQKPVRFVIYFPLGNGSDGRFSDMPLPVEEFIARRLEGLTSYLGTALFSNAGKIQREGVQVLEAFPAPIARAIAGEAVQTLGSLLARRIHQEGVAIPADGVLMLTDGTGNSADAALSFLNNGLVCWPPQALNLDER